MDEIVSMISFSVCLLLVYSKTTDLGVFILLPVTLLNVSALRILLYGLLGPLHIESYLHVTIL